MLSVSHLLDISNLFLLLLILTIFLAKKRLKIILIIITVLYYLVASGLLGFLLGVIVKDKNTNIQKCSNTSGIILLGGGASNSYNTIAPGISAYDRILKASQVYNNYPQKIIISGGITDNNKISEAEIYSRELKQLSIPKSDIYLESKSKNTYQNAEFIKKIISKFDNNTGNYCLITDALHLKRSQEIFSIFGIKNIGLASSKPATILSIIPRSDNIYVTQRIIHEYLGYIKSQLSN